MIHTYQTPRNLVNLHRTNNTRRVLFPCVCTNTHGQCRKRLNCCNRLNFTKWYGFPYINFSILKYSVFDQSLLWVGFFSQTHIREWFLFLIHGTHTNRSREIETDRSNTQYSGKGFKIDLNFNFRSWLSQCQLVCLQGRDKFRGNS